MFKIISQAGEIIGFTDELQYIKYDTENKVIRPTFLKEIANGILLDGYPYNLNLETIPNHPIVSIEEIANGEYIFSTYNQIVKNNSDINSMEQIILSQDNSIGMMEEAIMELDNNQAVDEGGES